METIETPELLYRRILSAKLSSLIWYPISSDTSSVVASQAFPNFSFSGGALLSCEGVGEVFLTWAQDRGEYCLTPSSIAESGWLPRALDRVQCRWNGAWKQADDAAIAQVRLYSRMDDPLRRLVAAQHELAGVGGTCTVWIGSGGTDWVGDGTDLWVSINTVPPNLSSLTLLSTIGSCSDD